MDAVLARTKTRLNRISEIEKALRQAKHLGREVDLKELLLASMESFGCTRRTAVEYLTLAKRRVNK